MVIQFSVSNYRSIHKLQTLNFRATRLVSEDKDVDNKNISVLNDDRILKTIGIYGPNASGKSNILRSFLFFKLMVGQSLNIENLSKNELSSFRQSTVIEEHAGYFEMVLLIESKKYRYGFSLNPNGEINSEWLFGPADKNETFYFKRKTANEHVRKSDTIDYNPLWFQEGEELPLEKLGNNVLFLSFCASYDGKISKSIQNFISDKITREPVSRRRINTFRASSTNNHTDNLIETGDKNLVLKWLKEAGLPFSDIGLQKVEISGRNYANFVILSKNIYSPEGKVTGHIQMNLAEDESDGTQKYYSYIGLLLKKFEEGGVFVSDEIDSNFHPSLVRKLISDFNNPSINKANAQLLFTSHDTNLMHPEIMRRDQFYFTEKSLMDETILYSLSDLKGIRNNADFARQYLAGVYGALPVLKSFMEERTSEEAGSLNQ